MKIFILDSAYPEFLNGLPPLVGTYQQELEKYLAIGFGTADFFSANLRKLGHECVDVIFNHHGLQHLWAKSSKWSLGAIALQQIEEFRPDVILFQDLNVFDAATLKSLAGKYLLAGQCSCALPRAEIAARYDVVFSSIPPHVEHFKSLGVRGEYLPLAFEHTLLEKIPPQERDIDVSFVGGVGASLHWKAGTHALESLASAIGERFHWYGYGLDRLAKDSPLRKCYRGEAWGIDMYEIYGRSRMVVNRHGEIAEGCANNLRMFEATGMGSMLITDNRRFLKDLFPDDDGPEHWPRVVEYSDAANLVAIVTDMIDNDFGEGCIADGGRSWTLKHHTYAHRMKRVSEVLAECLQKTAA